MSMTINSQRILAYLGKRVRYHSGRSNMTVEGKLTKIILEDRGTIRIGGEPRQMSEIRLTISGCSVNPDRCSTLEALD